MRNKVIQEAKLIGSHWYVPTKKPIDEIDIRNIGSSIRFNNFVEKDWNSQYEPYVAIQSREWYNNYKRRLQNDRALSNEYNYIYRVTKQLRLFVIDEYNLNVLISRNIIDQDLITHYYGGKKDWKKEVLATINTRNSSSINNLLSHCDKNVFFKYYDGFQLNDNDVYCFARIIKDNHSLVDGNIKRFLKSNESNVTEFPDWIKDELIRYTDEAGKKLNKSVKEWLKAQQKSYDSKILYRAFAIQFDDWGDYSKVTIEQVMKLIKQRCGVTDLAEFHKGGNITIKRGKESSWSTDPQIAMGFTRGWASASLNMMVKATINASDVVIDFTDLSFDNKKSYRFFNQNEVIVDTGKYSAKIVHCYAEPKFQQWLKEHQYEFINGLGIVER